MALAILPFAPEHVEPAAALLAARHRADRAREPVLPAAFGEVATAHAVVEATSRFPGTSGAFAVRDGRPVGFLLGASVIPDPMSRGTLFLQARSAIVSYGGHAAEAADAERIYREMYAAVAPGWIARGCFGHYVTVAAGDVVAREAWFALGFGRDATTAVRDTAPPAAEAPEVELRRATAADLDAVLAMALGLYRYHAGPPMFVAYLPEIEADERAHHEQMLRDRESVRWLAYRAGKPVGLCAMEPPPSFVSPLLRPPRSTYLLQGFTDPSVRGDGVGRALLARGLAWARETGQAHCLLHFLACNPTGARFWIAAGFRPIELRLFRRVDERVAWGRGA